MFPGFFLQTKRYHFLFFSFCILDRISLAKKLRKKKNQRRIEGRRVNLFKSRSSFPDALNNAYHGRGKHCCPKNEDAKRKHLPIGTQTAFTSQRHADVAIFSVVEKTARLKVIDLWKRQWIFAASSEILRTFAQQSEQREWLFG